MATSPAAVGSRWHAREPRWGPVLWEERTGRLEGAREEVVSGLPLVLVYSSGTWTIFKFLSLGMYFSGREAGAEGETN